MAKSRMANPYVVVVAHPNGAGKSTTARSLLRDTLQVREFVNADTIASGLSAFQPDAVAVSAGRIMLQRISNLAAACENFAFETTLARRSFAPRLIALKNGGYAIHLLFLWLRSADLAVDRVAECVCLGGHAVPTEVIRRRYSAGLMNLFRIYLPVADTWQLFDNSEPGLPRMIAAGEQSHPRIVADKEIWRTLSDRYGVK